VGRTKNKDSTEYPQRALKNSNFGMGWFNATMATFQTELLIADILRLTQP